MSVVAGRRIAIANRGEIAVRISATCRRLGAIPIALLGEPDRASYAARQIGRVAMIGEAGSEFDVDRVVAAAVRSNADLLHPGYGFLSERAELVEACDAAGVTFVGPTAETLRMCGDKLETRQAAERAGVPVLPASPPLGADSATWQVEGERVGYPLLVKPTAAGGGRGLRRVADPSQLNEAIDGSRRESDSSGAGDVVYLERELSSPRHIEVQVAGDGRAVVALGDRDCSVQRRHQKVIEEAPAPHLGGHIRQSLHAHARRIAEVVGLRGIATCEFLLGDADIIAFLEVNPRIQVEHPVTELVAGVDLVEWQLAIAAGDPLPLLSTPEPRGHAIEARVYAEDPERQFFPTTGKLSAVAWPRQPGVRVDAGYEMGDLIPGSYDAMLAKVIAHGTDRESGLASLQTALLDTVIAGVPTNVSWLLDLLDDPAILAGRATTRTASTVAPTNPDRRMAIFAAVSHSIEMCKSEVTDAWSAVGPWRLSGGAGLDFHGDDWEERVIIERVGTGWTATSGDKINPLRWLRDGSGVLTVTAGEATGRFAVIERQSEIEVYGHGGRWLLRTGPRAAAGSKERRRSSDGIVRAPLPAKVIGIHVDVGDEVSRGQRLVTLTAMKLELVCEAPTDGIIEAINCRMDELVGADDVLVTIQIARPD